MKRRDFIKTTAPATLAPFVVNGLPMKAFGASPLLSLMAQSSSLNGKVLVLIQLNGGNDGLNTVIPLDQYSNLSNARANVLIPDTKVLKLSGHAATGFHPAMAGLRTMFDNGLMSVVQDVGYPNPNFSHFRATDIWLTGSESNQYLDSGWLGRFLDGQYPGFPDNYPSIDMPDPLALQIGSFVSPAMQGPHVNMGMALSNPDSFYQLITGTTDPAPNTPAGHELTYIRLVNQQTQKYSTAIKAAADLATNKSTLYPSNNSLADQLKIVARLVAGGLKTPVYMTSIGGFDTHSAQVSTTGGNETGFHANLLKQVSEAVFAFQDDLKLLGVDDKVAGMTFSEFGRRIKSNASLGTDHGAAAPLLVFGKGVNPGIVGNNPTIPSSVSVNDNVPMQNDFRSVYTSVLADWFEISAADINAAMLQTFPVLPIFKKSGSNSVQTSALFSGGLKLNQNYPNPAVTETDIEFFTEGGVALLKLYDNMGREVSTIAEGTYGYGKHKVRLNVSDLAPGNYYYQLRNGGAQQTRHLVVYR